MPYQWGLCLNGFTQLFAVKRHFKNHGMRDGTGRTYSGEPHITLSPEPRLWRHSVWSLVVLIGTTRERAKWRVTDRLCDPGVHDVVYEFGVVLEWIREPGRQFSDPAAISQTLFL
jgi:hypothetical protein